MKKVLLILSDGMRPDSMTACGHPFVSELMAHSYYSMKAQTVMPSVTLPCHMSLFHAVTPERHGILTNTYVPQVRPVKGICEVLRAAKKNCAMFYNWEELKDLSRPDSLAYANYVSGHIYSYENANDRLTDLCIDYINHDLPDFTFLYLGWTDAAGHNNGWMSDEYLRAVKCSIDCIERVIRSIPEDYTVVITADHGGHGRSHGSDMPEDMTIPAIFYNRKYDAKKLDNVNIIDIAPTIVSMLGAEPDEDWEGKILPID
ncbi:MAG: alkaline phosphatase family protein [Clostridia bacterium]|nr:alkaline phosphatase family protein [Clostridia bacterium]